TAYLPDPTAPGVVRVLLDRRIGSLEGLAPFVNDASLFPVGGADQPSPAPDEGQRGLVKDCDVVGRDFVDRLVLDPLLQMLPTQRAVPRFQNRDFVSRRPSRRGRRVKGRF